jgi:hypothetical protein
MKIFIYKYFKWIFLFPASIALAGVLTQFENAILIFIYGMFLFLLPWIMYEGQRNSMYASYEMDNRFKLDNVKFIMIWFLSNGFIALIVIMIGKMF